MSQDKNNLKAGIFVAIGMILAIIVIFVLADIDQYFEQRQSVSVYFQLNDGLHGLKEGASVTLGDQLIGTVMAIQDRVETDRLGAMRVVGKDVKAQIPKRYDLYQNATIELKAPLIGSGTSLNIRSVGVGERYDGKRSIAGSIAGSAQVQELVREAGIQEKQREEIRSIIASFESMASTFREDVPVITQSVKDVLTDVHLTVVSLKQTVGDVGQIIGNAEQRHATWLDRIDRMTQSADQSLAVVHDLITDKEGQIRSTLDHVYGITEVTREKTVSQVTEVMDSTIEALASLKIILTELQSLAVGQRPVLEHTIANARLASDQLKLTAIEVRRSPWRLMYEPDEKELNTDNLYDAARSFALAAGVLDSTAQTLQALAARRAADDPRIKKMLEHLDAVFEEFKHAEEGLWKAIADEPAIR